MRLKRKGSYADTFPSSASSYANKTRKTPCFTGVGIGILPFTGISPCCWEVKP